ncbi:MAG TPA: cell division protein FtsA [Blastocatellia bacterium]|nr:cell division protein FtsA [Blastocatellia bacterium]HMX27886.1 cell division protein FtsA [Blastocatellia bacterium]HMY71656.1 cell division protein FtsA [Blastocatellia bacterium]HMZ21415.1 cell division protein FtsA [Blastocatellia bacterium]HNG32317.1 cell division protein FtsA [Blastocatellia bacterium]
MAKQNSSSIVGLDIGTGSVRVVIAELIEGELEIVGVGEAESRGLRKGVISKPDLTIDSIKRAVEAAERMSGLQIHDVYVGLAGSHIKGENSHGMIAIPGRHREITREDIRRVIDTACAISIPSGREVADVLPQEYTVDDQDGIDDPLGMLGSRLSVSVHIVTSPVAAKQNVTTSVARAGYNVTDIYLSHLAAAEAVLTDEDREYGSAVVNIGSETTSVAIYQRGAVWHTAVLPIGGSHFTNDIAVGLRTPIPEAERIKREEGCAHRMSLTQEEASDLIEVPSVGGRAPRAVSRQILCDILEPRAEEVLSHVQDEIRQAGFDRQLSSGIVLTGGGALLNGIVEVAEQVFNAPVRIGATGDFNGLIEDAMQPAYSAAIGLALYGLRCELGIVGSSRNQGRRASSPAIKDRVKSFFGIKR